MTPASSRAEAPRTTAARLGTRAERVADDDAFAFASHGTRARVAPAATAIEQGMAVARREARGAREGVRSGPAPGEVGGTERRGRTRPLAARSEVWIGREARAALALIRGLSTNQIRDLGREKANLIGTWRT